MNIIQNRYFNIVIHDNNSFSIATSASKPQKDGTALATLKKIEKIVHDNLQYDARLNDIYSTMNLEEVYRILQGKAVEISTGYREKITNLNWFWKILCWITVKRTETNLNFTLAKIENRLSKSQLFPRLPTEIIQHIGSYLPVPDLLTWNSINRDSAKHASQAIIARAQKFGYDSKDRSSAIFFIKRFFKQLHDMRQLSLVFSVPSLKEVEQITDKLRRINMTKGFIPLLLKMYQKFPLHLREDVCSYIEKIYFKRMQNHTESIIQWNDSLKNQAVQLLSYAVRNYNAKLVQILLQEGIDPNTPPDKTQYSLHIAAQDGHSSTVSILLQYGADVKTRDLLSGNTALLFACDSFRGSREDIVQQLLNHGADIHIRNNKGNGALHIAAQNGYTRVVEMLLKNGADINQKSENGNTALMLASGNWFAKETVQCLLQYGANQDIVNDAGQTANTIAQQIKKPTLIQLC